MSEEPPLVRQWVLLRLLSGRRFGVTIKEMAQEMGVSDKTIRRDLETFEQAGFPLQVQIGEFGRKTWRLEGNSQPGLAFTFDEAITTDTALNATHAVQRFSGIHDSETGGRIRAGVWFTHKKRALLSEYGVGTVDQSLLTILPVRHQSARIGDRSANQEPNFKGGKHGCDALVLPDL
jgi:hypothetical protein